MWVYGVMRAFDCETTLLVRGLVRGQEVLVDEMIEQHVVARIGCCEAFEYLGRTEGKT
jgi:hypothetical protein